MKNKMNNSTIGLLQALGVVAYCTLVSLFFWSAQRYFPEPDVQFLTPILMLTLLVFSAATTGAIVFGYPTYLGLQNKIKDALNIFAYTLLYCLLFIFIIIAVLGIIG